MVPPNETAKTAPKSQNGAKGYTCCNVVSLPLIPSISSEKIPSETATAHNAIKDQ
jgi:hypothetical protein